MLLVLLMSLLMLMSMKMTTKMTATATAMSLLLLCCYECHHDAFSNTTCLQAESIHVQSQSLLLLLVVLLVLRLSKRHVRAARRHFAMERKPCVARVGRRRETCTTGSWHQ